MKSAYPTTADLQTFLRDAGVEWKGNQDMLASFMEAGIEEVERRTSFKWIAESAAQTYSYTATIGSDGTIYFPDAFYTVTSIAWQPVNGTSTAWTLSTDYTLLRYGTNGPVIGIDTLRRGRLPASYYENDALRVTGRRGRGETMPTEGWLAMVELAAVRAYEQVREERMRVVNTIALGDGMSMHFAGGDTVQMAAAHILARWQDHADRWVKANRRGGAGIA